MHTKNRRPVFLNLLRLRLPVGGVLSIIHRLTGVLLVFILPGLIYLLQLSLSGREGFSKVVGLLDAVPVRLFLLFLLWVFAQHFFSGIRHLLLDIDIGITKAQARRGAYLVFTLNAAIVVVAAVSLL